MSLNFCHIHGAHSGLYTCPRCEKEYLREQYDRENPGEYGCPHCRYITLRYRATRCPSCQGEVERYFWDDLDAREAAAANALGVAEATKRQYRLGLEAQYGAAIKKAVRRNTIFYVLYYLATVLLVFCSFMANIKESLNKSPPIFARI